MKMQIQLRRRIFFFPCELSDFLPIHGPKIATITIAVEVARPNCWSVHPFSLTNQTEKYKPGIRIEKNSFNKKDDQKRTLTPKEAINLGADFLVIGRPIIQSKNPLETIKKINQSIQ